MLRTRTNFGFDPICPLTGDPELRKVLAAMFLEDCPKLLSEIRNAMTQHDGPSLKVAVHTLKGSAGVFVRKRLLKLRGVIWGNFVMIGHRLMSIYKACVFNEMAENANGTHAFLSEVTARESEDQVRNSTQCWNSA